MSANNVFAYPYVDQRFGVEASITTTPSELKYPFYTLAIIVPRTLATTYLVGTFESNVFYKIKQSEYATRTQGDLQKGLASFFNQARTSSAVGVIIFEDEVALDPLTPNQKTEWLQVPEAKRNGIIATLLSNIGRNALAITIASDNLYNYRFIMDDVRRNDTTAQFLKFNFFMSAIDTKDKVAKFEDEMSTYAGTLEVLLSAKDVTEDESKNETISMDDRPDFILAGAYLNPYTPTGSTTSYEVGMSLDGMIVNLKNASIAYNKDSSMLDTLTSKQFTYLQVRADDETEVLVAGGGVMYRGATIPVNLFILAKWGEYYGKSYLLKENEKSRFGVANVNVYKNAIGQIVSKLDAYVGVLLYEISSKSYSQKEINNAVVDGVVNLENCITVTTLKLKTNDRLTFTIGI